MIYIKPEILDRVNSWLTPVFDEKIQKEIKHLIASNPKDLEESFENCKCKMVDSTPLFLPQKGKQFVVQTDACDYAANATATEFFGGRCAHESIVETESAILLIDAEAE